MIVDIVVEKNGEKLTIHAEGFMPFANLSFRNIQQYSLRKKYVRIFKEGVTTKVIEYFIPEYLKEEVKK